MQTIETLLQQGIATSSIDMTSLVSSLQANLSPVLTSIEPIVASIDPATLASAPQMLDLNQDGVIDGQDLQIALTTGLAQPINCEPLDALLPPVIDQPLEALVQTVLTQPLDVLAQNVMDQVIDLNGKAPYILSDAQLAELGLSLQASGVPADITAAVLNDMQTLTEAILPTATEPVAVAFQPWMAKEAGMVVPAAPMVAPVADAAVAHGVEPVFYNDGQTGDAFEATIIEPTAPNGSEPVVYNDGQTGEGFAMSSHPVAPEAPQSTVFDASASAAQVGQVVDSWLDAHQGNPWINLTGAATGAAPSEADSITLTLKDLLAMPSDVGGMYSAKITGDASDTVNLVNIFGNGSDAPLGHWDVQGSVVQDGQSFTAYNFSGNAQLQVLVDDHIQHVNLS